MKHIRTHLHSFNRFFLCHLGQELKGDLTLNSQTGVTSGKPCHGNILVLMLCAILVGISTPGTAPAPPPPPPPGMYTPL